MYLVQRDSPKLGEHQPLCKSLKHAPLMAPSLPKTGRGRNQMKCLAVGVKPILCGNANPAKYVFFPLLLCIFSRFSNRLLTRPFWTARIHRHNEKCSDFLHAVFTAQTAAYRRVRLSRIGVYGLQRWCMYSLKPNPRESWRVFAYHRQFSRANGWRKDWSLPQSSRMWIYKKESGSTMTRRQAKRWVSRMWSGRFVGHDGWHALEMRFEPRSMIFSRFDGMNELPKICFEVSRLRNEIW